MIVFTSRTGNARYIVSQLELPSVEITVDLAVSVPYILFTFTDGLGEIPEIVVAFLNNFSNIQNLKGVVATGNVNFGDNFCNSAEIISKKYNVPIIRKIDLRGTKEDLDSIKYQYSKYIRGE
jgi:protein involved in ribonucleotide reduction